MLDKRKLKQRCTHLDAQVELLSEQLGRATKLEDNKPQRNDKLIQTLEDVSSSYSSAELARMERESSQLREERVQLRSELTSMIRVVQDLESQVRVSQDENANLSTGLEELDIQHQEAIEQMLAAKEEIQKRYEQLSVEFEELKNKYEELKIVNETLNKEKTEEKHLEIETEIKMNYEKLLLTEIQNLVPFSIPLDYYENNESMNSVLGVISAVVKMFNNFLNEKETSDAQVKKLKYKLQEVEDELDAVEHENMRLQASVEQLTKQCNTLQPIPENNKELEALDEKNNILEKEVNVLREVRSNLEVELDGARNTIFDLTQRLQANEAMIKNQDNLQNELAMLQVNEQSLRNELNALIKVKDSIEKENSDLKEMKIKDEELQKKLDELQDKCRKDIEKETLKNSDVLQELEISKEETKQLRKEILSLNELYQEKEMRLNELDLIYNSTCKKLSSLESKCLELDEIIVSLKIENESKERKMCELILEKSTSDKNLEQLKEIYESVDYNIKDLKNKCSIKDEDINKLKMQLEEVSEKYAASSKNLSEMSNKNDSLKSAIMNVDEELKKKIDEIYSLNIIIKNFEEEKFPQLEKINTEKTLECNVWQLKCSELKNVIAELEQTLKAAEKENSQIAEISTEQVFLEKKCSELENTIKDVTDKLNHSEHEKKSALQKINSEKNAELDIWKKRSVELETTILNLEETLKTLEQEKCSALEQFTFEKKEECDKLYQKCSELEKTISDLVNEQESFKKEKISLTDKLNDVISELNDKSNCLQKITDQLKRMENTKDEIEKECLKLKQELTVIQTEGENFEKSKEKHEMALDSITKLSQAIADREKENEELKLSCDNLNQQLTQLLDERNQLIKSLQAKHLEGLEYHNEIQRLNKLLSEELTKTAKLTSDIALMNKNSLDLHKKIEEKEEAVRLQDKEVLNLKLHAETLQNQLEYASQLLRVTDRQEAEGQPSTDVINPALQVVSPGMTEEDKEYIVTLEKEKKELAESLLKEQTRNKYLQNEVQEHHEKEISLAKEVERLRTHLVNVEDNYTQEMVRAEEQVKELQQRLSQADERVKNSSTAYTSASIRANQQVETLQAQARLMAEQRDKIQSQLSASEDRIQKQAAALTNLQIVLEQFQRDKERDILSETERIKQSLYQAHQKNENLKDEIKSLQIQLGEAKEGLSAAARLGEQLERKDQAISDLKLEVNALTEKLHKMEEKIKATSTGAEGKVDRYLVKNLLVGFLSAPQQSRMQALRVLATVVDLSHEERQRVGLEPASSSDALQQQSLSEAFVRFLENESRPQPSLRLSLAEAKPNEPKSRRSSASVLLPDVLPNIPQFTAGRNSGSILKDVLKDDQL
ncbi:uncharacterized protein LOC142319004 isoform X2 [Lycorma delicatula]